MTSSCAAYCGREGHTLCDGSSLCLFFVDRIVWGGTAMGRYSKLIEMVSLLHLYSILRRAFFLSTGLRVCQSSVSSTDSTEGV